MRTLAEIKTELKSLSTDRKEFAEMLTPPVDPKEHGPSIRLLFSTFADTVKGDEDRINAYMMALSDVSVVACREAVIAYNSGRVHGYDSQFMPNPPTLAKECRRRMEAAKYLDKLTSIHELKHQKMFLAHDDCPLSSDQRDAKLREIDPDWEWPKKQLPLSKRESSPFERLSFDALTANEMN